MRTKNDSEEAFDVSVEAHKDQRRKSGETYIFIHCCGKMSLQKLVWELLLLLQLLMHDVVERPQLFKILNVFNPKVAQLRRINQNIIGSKDLNASCKPRISEK
jgi:GTP pyrophosphokinase